MLMNHPVDSGYVNMTSELLKELRSRAANEKNITKNMNVLCAGKNMLYTKIT